MRRLSLDGMRVSMRKRKWEEEEEEGEEAGMMMTTEGRIPGCLVPT